MGRVLDFRPPDLLSCVLWLRADQGITLDAANNVKQWNDLSSQGNHVTVPPSSAGPAYALNVLSRQPCVRFLIARSTALYRANVNLVGTGPYTMCLAHQQMSTATSYTFGNTNATASTGGMAFGTNATSRNNLHQNVANHSDGTTQLLSPEVWIATYDGSTVPVFYLNGVPTTVTGTNGMLTPSTTGAIAVGAFMSVTTPSAFASADVMEGVIYNRQLSLAEVNLLNQYMSSRYLFPGTT